MDASMPSCSWLLVAAAASVTAHAALVADATVVRAPMIDVPVEQASAPPALLPPCEHYPEDLSLRSAMQTCSMYADLETNEHWFFEVRAHIVDHRMTDMVLTNIDRDCDHCFNSDDVDDRQERARFTLAAVTACMREQLASATFNEDSCTLDTRWSIRSDW